MNIQFASLAKRFRHRALIFATVLVTDATTAQRLLDT